MNGRPPTETSLSFRSRTLAAAVLGLVLTTTACLPDLDLPTCATNADCVALGEGWCSCLEGYCYRLACPVVPADTSVADLPDSGASPDVQPSDTALDPTGDAAGDTTVDALADAPEADIDAGPCPPLLSDPANNSACLLATSQLALAGVTYPPVMDSAGRFAIVHGTKLTILGSDLQSLGTRDIGQSLGPVVRPDGRIGITTISGLQTFDAADVSATTATDYGAGLASLPAVVDASGSLAMKPNGGVALIGPGDDLPEPVVSADPVFHVALAAAGDLLHVIDSQGAMAIIDIEKARAVYETTDTIGPPAPVAADAVVFLTSDGRVGGAVLSGGSLWTALPPTNVGQDPTPPVVASDRLVITAAMQEKRVSALRLLGATPVQVWIKEDLPEPAAASPAILSDGAIAVPLAGGELVVLEPSGGPAPPAIRWRYTLSGELFHPRPLPDGSLLLMTDQGNLARVVAAAPGSAHPWPTLHADAASWGRAH